MIGDLCTLAFIIPSFDRVYWFPFEHYLRTGVVPMDCGIGLFGHDFVIIGLEQHTMIFIIWMVN